MYAIVFFKSGHLTQQTLYSVRAGFFASQKHSTHVSKFSWFDFLSWRVLISINPRRVPYAQWFCSQLQVLFVSQYFYGATFRTPVRREHTITVFQQFRTVDVVHSNPVCSTVQVDGSVRVQRHHAVHIVVLMVADRLGQGLAVCFIDVAQKVILILELILPLIGSFAQVVVRSNNWTQTAIQMWSEMERWLSEDFWADVCVKEKRVVAKERKINRNKDARRKNER